MNYLFMYPDWNDCFMYFCLLEMLSCHLFFGFSMICSFCTWAEMVIINSTKWYSTIPQFHNWSKTFKNIFVSSTTFRMISWQQAEITRKWILYTYDIPTIFGVFLHQIQRHRTQKTEISFQSKYSIHWEFQLEWINVKCPIEHFIHDMKYLHE